MNTLTRTYALQKLSFVTPMDTADITLGALLGGVVATGGKALGPMGRLHGEMMLAPDDSTRHLVGKAMQRANKGLLARAAGGAAIGGAAGLGIGRLLG